MASHVSICMEHGIAIKRSSQPVRRGGKQQRGKEKKREEMREREMRKGKEKRKREKKEKKERQRKEADGFFLSSLAFRQSELVGRRSKVRRFDEGLFFKR